MSKGNSFQTGDIIFRRGCENGVKRMHHEAMKETRWYLGVMKVPELGYSCIACRSYTRGHIRDPHRYRCTWSKGFSSLDCNCADP